MLTPSAEAVRLFLHVIAACVWVGGQLTLAGLLPTVRTLGPDAPKALARQFGRLQWPAFVMLVVTGVWNIVVIEGDDHSSAWGVSLMFKLLLVALAGMSAALHSTTKDRRLLALGGAVSLLASLGAVFVGVQLAVGR